MKKQQPQGFCHCHKYSINKTIHTITHNPYVCFKSAFLPYGLRLIQDYPINSKEKPSWNSWAWVAGFRCNRLDDPVLIAGPKSLPPWVCHQVQIGESSGVCESEKPVWSIRVEGVEPLPASFITTRSLPPPSDFLIQFQSSAFSMIWYTYYFFFKFV